MTHDDYQDDHDWDDLLARGLGVDCPKCFARSGASCSGRPPWLTHGERRATAVHVVKCPRCGKDKWKFLGGGPEPPCGPCWRALYDSEGDDQEDQP